MELLTHWWVWIGIALGLGILELLLPGFIFLGFAGGAAVLGIAMALLPALFAGISFNALMAIFAGLSLICWLLLRFAFRGQSSGARVVTHDIND